MTLTEREMLLRMQEVLRPFAVRYATLPPESQNATRVEITVSIESVRAAYLALHTLDRYLSLVP